MVPLLWWKTIAVCPILKTFGLAFVSCLNYCAERSDTLIYNAMSLSRGRFSQIHAKTAIARPVG